MKHEKFNKVGKALAIAGVTVGLLGAGVGAYALSNPKIIEVTNTINNTVIEKVPVEVIKEVMVNNTIEIEKIVEVMNEEQVKVLCDKLGFEELDECVDEVMAEHIAIEKVLDFIDEEFNGEISDMLEDEGIINDEDDVELIRTYSDFTDINIVKSDFDNEEYVLEVKLKIEDTDSEKKKYVTVKVELEDNELTLKKVLEL